MAINLPVSRLINVSVNLSPTPAAGRNFGNLLVLGDSDVITGLERNREYASTTEVAADFGVEAPEYLAALLYFGQSPPPKDLTIGRWLRTATAGQLQGALLTAAQSAVGLFNSITSGGFTVSVNSVSVPITGLDLSTALNLNGVASTITAAFSGAATMVWSGSQFILTSATSGAGVKASGTITFSGNPVALDTVTVNGVVITFVAASPTGNQVLIGGTGNLTAVNLNTFLAASANVLLTASTYSVAAGVVTVRAAAVGTAGNSITLAESATNVVVSGATLTGGLAPSSVSFATAPGSGQDISALLGMTSALALPLVPGYAAESPLEAVVALDAISTKWYGSMFAASVMPTDLENVDVAAFIESAETTRIFGATITDTDVLSALVTDDLASLLMALNYKQSFTQYSSSSPYAVASMFGRAFSVNFEAENTTLDLMYKQEPGVVAENITTAQANALKAKRCNVFATYSNDTSILQYGTMAGDAFFDEIHGLDWFQNAVQTACFNVNYTSATKVPQTDQGVNQYVNAIGGVCETSVRNGLAAPGVWGAAGFGQLLQGQYLKAGYYIYAQPVALQSASDRAAREAPPIQVALKLAGSVQTVDVLVSVNR